MTSGVLSNRLVEGSAGLRPRAIEMLEEVARICSPAMKRRGRKLLKKLRSNEPAGQ